MSEHNNLEISESLGDAYYKCIFRVFLEDGILEMKINNESLRLKALMQNLNVDNCALITAWNPYGKVMSDDDNSERHQSLLKDVKYRWSYYEGDGLDPNGEWEPEKSLFLIGITIEEARELAKKYTQLAFVSTNRIGFARLIATDPSQQDKLAGPLSRW